jgi:hypothetical protein
MAPALNPHNLLNDPMWLALVVEHIGDPRTDDRWPYWILKVLGIQTADQVATPMQSKARLTLCVFLWVNGLEPQNIVALGRPLALHGLLRDDAAKTNWESIVERLINNKSFRETKFSYDMVSGTMVRGLN